MLGSPRGVHLVGRRIVLITNNQCTTPYPVFPLGVAHVAAALKRASHRVKIVDLLAASENLEFLLKTFKPDYVGVSQRNFDDLNIRDPLVFTDNIDWIIKRIRKVSRAPIIMGGSGFSLFPAEILERTKADFGIQGEGERAFVQLISALQGSGDLRDIAGLVFRCEGTIRINEKKPCTKREIISPFRPRSLCRWYLQKSLMLNIQTQRGCYFNCCYCTYPVLEGKTVCRRDYSALTEELLRARRIGCRYFYIVDSVFNTSNDHVRAFCEKIIRHNVNMHWGCFLRPQGLTAELLKLMARAGLTHIEFGSDSFCDSVLNAYGKQFSFHDILRSSELARKASVHYAHFLIIGGPSETEATVLESYAHSRQFRKTVIFPYVGMRIYPQTRLYAIACGEGSLDRKADLFSPRFYISPHISMNKVFGLLRKFNTTSPHWIVEKIPASLEKVMRGLRCKGIAGPLWEFLAR